MVDPSDIDAAADRIRGRVRVTPTIVLEDGLGLGFPLELKLEHLERVLGLLEARGVAYRRLRPAPYAGRMMAFVRPDEPERLLDTLLVCAFIEARSCERMQRLAERLDGDLGALYRDLLASEARHHALYVDLARQIAGRSAVEARLPEVARHEAQVLAEAPTDPRLHNA